MGICIFCEKNKELTSEHIVPEFLGGTLEFKSVCKSCNSKMGNSFEGNLANSIFFKMPRYLYNIQGKAKQVKFPFSGSYELDNFGRVGVGADGTLTTFSSVKIEETGENVEIKVSLDPKELHGGRNLLAKGITRHLRKKGIIIDKDKLSEFTNNFFEKENTKYQRIQNPELQTDFELNINDFRLLYTKIAYEIACFHFGNNYMVDPTANILRQSLCNQDISRHIQVQIPIMYDQIENFFEDTYHWVLLLGNLCCIKLFGISGQLQYTSRNSLFREEKGFVYKFYYTPNRFCEKLFFSEHLLSTCFELM